MPSTVTNMEMEAPRPSSVNLGISATLARVAVVFMWLSAATVVLLMVWFGLSGAGNQDRHGCDYEKWKELDAPCIKQRWMRKSERGNIGLLLTLFLAISYLLIVPAVNSLGDVFGNRHAMKHVMTGAVNFGAMLTVVELFFMAGTSSVTKWMARSSSNWTDTDWQALEISDTVVQGSFTWLFSLDPILIGIGMWSASYLGNRSNLTFLDRKFIWLGYAGAVVSAVVFAGDVAKIVGFWVAGSTVDFVTKLILQFIILPAWMLYVASFLTKVKNEDFGSFLTGDAGSGLLGGSDTA